jgi:hypothetical protein
MTIPSVRIGVEVGLLRDSLRAGDVQQQFE